MSASGKKQDDTQKSVAGCMLSPDRSNHQIESWPTHTSPSRNAHAVE